MPTFLYDAAPFVRATTVTIDIAPLKAYSSALTFTPKKSVVKKISGAGFPGGSPFCR
jgi:hypothetical protein